MLGLNRFDAPTEIQAKGTKGQNMSFTGLRRARGIRTPYFRTIK